MNNRNCRIFNLAYRIREHLSCTHVDLKFDFFFRRSKYGWTNRWYGVFFFVGKINLFRLLLSKLYKLIYDHHDTIVARTMCTNQTIRIQCTHLDFVCSMYSLPFSILFVFVVATKGKKKTLFLSMLKYRENCLLSHMQCTHYLDIAPLLTQRVFYIYMFVSQRTLQRTTNDVCFATHTTER